MKFLKSTLILFLGLSILASCKNERNEKSAAFSEALAKTEIVSSLKNPTAVNSVYPRLFGTDKKLFMSWVEERDSISVLYFSTFENGDWTEPIEVNSGDDWFISIADFPIIAENNGNILINYLQNPVNARNNYDVKINLFSTETQSWKKDILLHHDGTASEHGFISAVPYGESSFYVIWLDGRNTVAKAGSHHTSGGPPMSLRGRIVHADGTMEPSVELDDRVCDCCQTAMVSIDDAPVLVYRDRTDAEVRDISRIGLYDDSFSPPMTVYNDNWKISGCPVSGPAIASYKNNVAVAWFTAVNNLPKVQLAFSKDKGKTFGMPIQVNNNDTTGGVDVVMISEDTAVVSWIENSGDETLIQVMRVSADGSKGFPMTISRSSVQRVIGTPQLEMADHSLYAAWMNVEETENSIKTAVVSMEEL